MGTATPVIQWAGGGSLWRKFALYLQESGDTCLNVPIKISHLMEMGLKSHTWTPCRGTSLWGRASDLQEQAPYTGTGHTWDQWPKQMSLLVKLWDGPKILDSKWLVANQTPSLCTLHQSVVQAFFRTSCPHYGNFEASPGNFEDHFRAQEDSGRFRCI